MSAHNHRERTPGCFRCETAADEIGAAMTDDLLNAHGCTCDDCAGGTGGPSEAAKTSQGRFWAAQARIRDTGRDNEGQRARRRA